MWLRIVSALIALPIALALIHLGGWPFYALVAFVGTVALLEWMAMAAPDDRPAQGLCVLVGLVATGTIATGTALSPVGLAAGLLSVLVLLLFFLFRTGEIEGAASRLGLCLAGVVWVGGLLGAVAALRALPDGIAWLYLAFAISFGSDTGGYFAGRFFGKHKLYEKVSPKKTWEGAIGGVLFSIVASLVIRFVLGPLDLALPHIVVMAGVGAALGQTGDLAESLIKRSVGVKDSGKIMPGHGGLLDRIDALLFVGVWLFAYAVVVLQLSPTWTFGGL